LRSAGLSGSKSAAIKDLAAKTLDGTIPRRNAFDLMSDEEIIARLTTVRGIGRWTVEMFLLFDLQRLDVWPVDDYGVRKGYAKTFRKKQLPTPKELFAIGERWRPYRSVAAWYFWRALELTSRRGLFVGRPADVLVRGSAMSANKGARVEPPASVFAISCPEERRHKFAHLEMKMREVLSSACADSGDPVAAPHLLAGHNQDRLNVAVE
jgi:hypothetical protein